jgi:UDP-N-acetylglucosamine 1-carboxyvinyltransferase
MAVFEIQGGKKLKGELIPQGAKNEALQVICAVLMTEGDVTIHNIPDILDVNNLIDLLAAMGVKINRISRATCHFNAKDIAIDYLLTDEYKAKASALRGSVMVLGPLLSRFKKAYLPKPGGDRIGRRPIDTHLTGFEKLGAKFVFDDNSDFFTINAEALHGSYMLLDEPSVTGTANILMAATMASGTTTIYNAACEPYLQQLCLMLNRMGAKISGIGSNLLVIEGVEKLAGCDHTILPDMIEIGSFIGLAAMTASEITIKNCRVDMLGMIPDVFRKMGIRLEIQGDDIYIPSQDSYEITKYIDGSILTIYDHPWPGFTPDLLSIVLVVAIQAKGSILIHQKMFESRLFFVDKLKDMGAQITLCDPHRAIVIGIDKQRLLRGISMSSPDIRAGVALLIAALSAKGKSVIHNIEQIDRGYQSIEARLSAIGADIVRK